jgi:hypothetical protein
MYRVEIDKHIVSSGLTIEEAKKDAGNHIVMLKSVDSESVVEIINEETGRIVV